MKTCVTTTVAAIVFLPLVWLRGSLPINVALYFVFAIGYGVLLFRLRILSTDQFLALRSVFAGRRVDAPEWET